MIWAVARTDNPDDPDRGLRQAIGCLARLWPPAAYDSEIGLREISAFEHDRLPSQLRQCIGETIAEIQARRMAAALPVLPVCGNRNQGLFFGEGNDLNREIAEQPINALLSIGPGAGEHHYCRLKIGRRPDQPRRDRSD